MSDTNLKPLKKNGFEGRTFLTEAEWKTYRRARAVRYAQTDDSTVLCESCGKKGTKKNPLQNAHKIGHAIGTDHVGLTPEALLRSYNIVKAHKSECNRKVEAKTPSEIADFLVRKDGYGISIEEFPAFMRKQSPNVWKALQAIEAPPS